MDASTIRVFICIPLSLSACERLQEIVRPLAKRFSRLRWIPPENWHITIRFVGNIDRIIFSELVRATAVAVEAKNMQEFELEIKNVDKFPPEKYRIVAAYLEGHLRLSQLFLNLNNAAEKAGLEREERVFLPHITLAKSHQPVLVFDSLTYEDFLIPAQELVIYESQLTKQDSHYILLYKFPFSLNSD